MNSRHPSAIDRAYERRLDIARSIKAQGGKVVGHVSTAVPVEVIMAAGMHPVMITGDCDAPTPLADEWMESMFDPMARAIFQSALAGELEFRDALIIPRTADSFMRLYLYLREIERQGICTRLPQIVSYDLLQSNGEHAARHNLAQLETLRALLASIGGRIDDDALRGAIAVSNENRLALRELVAKRRQRKISAERSLKAITTRYLMPMREHTDLIRQASTELVNADTAGPCIVVAGNAQDNPALHALLDESGFHVVGDYHWLGDSVCEHDIDATVGSPLQAISRFYHRYSLSSRRFPHTPDELVRYATECGAQGVVFYLFETEEALTWDSPNQVSALSKVGIPSLVFENQPYVIDASAARPRLAEFAATLQVRR